MDDEGKEITTIREGYVNFPLIFMGNGIIPETVHSPVTVDCIAPTLAMMMRIRAPNGCDSAPISDIRK